ncbi:MAG: hypothetical protein AAGC60_29470 [Acidobacteriota bacterium]
MTAVHLHLAIVHLPVVGVLCAAALLVAAEVAAWRTGDARTAVPTTLRLSGWSVLLVSALTGIVAYYSGPSAYEQLDSVLADDKEFVERHAVLGRAAFVGLIVAAALALQGVVHHLQEEPPLRWLHRVVLVLVLGLCYLLAWAAHLGGQIRHEEIRDPSSRVFPSWVSMAPGSGSSLTRSA